jgi:hypothetical protein
MAVRSGAQLVAIRRAIYSPQWEQREIYDRTVVKFLTED